MPVNYGPATINSRLTAVVTNIDAGAGSGQMRLLNSTNQTVALIGLQKPSGTVAAGVLTFSGLPLAAPTLLGDQIVAADIEDSTGVLVASGLTVGQSTASDIVMADTTASIGDIISLTFATITGV